MDLSVIRRNFLITANYILSNRSFASDLVKLELLEKHCLPILLYCLEVLDVSVSQLKDINSWSHSVY